MLPARKSFKTGFTLVELLVVIVLVGLLVDVGIQYLVKTLSSAKTNSAAHVQVMVNQAYNDWITAGGSTGAYDLGANNLSQNNAFIDVVVGLGVQAPLNGQFDVINFTDSALSQSIRYNSTGLLPSALMPTTLNTTTFATLNAALSTRPNSLPSINGVSNWVAFTGSNYMFATAGNGGNGVLSTIYVAYRDF